MFPYSMWALDLFIYTTLVVVFSCLIEFHLHVQFSFVQKFKELYIDSCIF